MVGRMWCVGEKQDSGLGIQEPGSDDGRWAVVNVVIPSEARNLSLETRDLRDSSSSRSARDSSE